jgi:hypothetical protein
MISLSKMPCHNEAARSGCSVLPDVVAKFDQLREQKKKGQPHKLPRATGIDSGSILYHCCTLSPACRPSGAGYHGNRIGISPLRSNHRREACLALRLSSRPSCPQSTSSNSVRGEKFKHRVLNHRRKSTIVSETYLAEVACLARDDMIMDVRHLLALKIDV